MREEMTLQDYLRLCGKAIWKNKYIIAAFTILFLLVGILRASYQTVSNTYYAKATIYTLMGTDTKETTTVSTAISGYADILTSKKICERAEAILGDSNISAEEIQGMISSSFNKSSTIMTVSAYSDDATKAVNVANAVAEAFVSEIQSVTGSDKIQILDEANKVKLSSNGFAGLMKNIILCGIAGFALSLGYVICRVIFSTKISTVVQCIDEDESEILGVIPFIEKNK